MANRFERVFRDRKLTPDEDARDEELRRKVFQEFPPATSSAAAPSDSLSEALRQAIRESGKSIDEVAKDAEVSPIVIARFLSGERDIRMATADKLAAILGAKLENES